MKKWKSIYFEQTSTKKDLFFLQLKQKNKKKIKWTGFTGTKKLKRLVWIIWIIQVISDHNQQTAFGDLANVHEKVKQIKVKIVTFKGTAKNYLQIN